jgi:multiple sugar transport system substrate-binding protein
VRRQLLLATILTLGVAACGGGGDRKSGTPAVSEDPGGGNATYCAHRVLKRPESAAVAQFNRAHRDDGFKARFQALHDRTRIPDICDVALVDSLWLAHHAATGALADLTKRVEQRKGDFFGATLGLARYDERYWGFPRHVDVGFLYYKVAAGTPPLTWQDAYAFGRRGNGLVYAGAHSTELAVRFLEVAYPAGGGVLSKDGRASELDSPENVRALELMRRGVARGAVPRSVLRMDLHDARVAFARGATVLRDWTFGFRSLRIDNFRSGTEILELPAFGDRPATPVLVGLSVTVAEDARTEAAALALADYLTGPEEAMRLIKRHRLPTALSASYDGAWAFDWIPYVQELERSLEAARVHPITPRWPQMARAIGARVRDALTGRMSPRAALAAADRDVAALLSG